MAKRLDLEFAFDAAIAQTQKCIETGLVTARGEEAELTLIAALGRIVRANPTPGV